MEDWVEIRRLHKSEGMAIKAISRKLGISRNAVRRALASDSPPAYSRPVKGSVVDAVEPRIRELLRDTPTMPATVIAERIDWEHGLTTHHLTHVNQLASAGGHCRYELVLDRHRAPGRLLGEQIRHGCRAPGNGKMW